MNFTKAMDSRVQEYRNRIQEQKDIIAARTAEMEQYQLQLDAMLDADTVNQEAVLLRLNVEKCERFITRAQEKLEAILEDQPLTWQEHSELVSQINADRDAKYQKALEGIGAIYAAFSEILDKLDHIDAETVKHKADLQRMCEDLNVDLEEIYPEIALGSGRKRIAKVYTVKSDYLADRLKYAKKALEDLNDYHGSL